MVGKTPHVDKLHATGVRGVLGTEVGVDLIVMRVVTEYVPDIR